MKKLVQSIVFLLFVAVTARAQTPIANERHIVSPTGGQSSLTYSQTPVVTGYLKITLPQSWTNTMIKMTIDIFDFNTNQSRTLNISGYNYNGLYWYNVSANQQSSDDEAIKVSFGHDGTKCAIYLSKVTKEGLSEWSHPSVLVRDVFVSYYNTEAEKWNTGWQVGFTPTLGTGVITQSAIATSTKGNRISYSPAFLTENFNFKNKVFQANGANPRRHVLGRIYYNDANWGTYGNMTIKLKSYIFRGFMVEYLVQNMSKEVKVTCTKAVGSDFPISKTKISVSTPIDAGTEYGGVKNYYVELYLDLDYYSYVVAEIETTGDFAVDKTTVSGTEYSSMILFSNPEVRDNITTFNDIKNVNIGNTSPVNERHIV